MSHFIPPFSLGGFKPSPATLSEFIYQIWLYLQQNPIMPEDEIKQEIAETIPPAVKDYVENNPDMAQSIADIVNEYLVENPPEAPVQSVNSQTGDVVIGYNSLVPANIQIPVFLHNTAATPNASTIIGLRNGGFRFTFNTETAKLSIIKSDYTLQEVAAGDVLSVNNKTGAVTLTAADIEVDPEEGDTNLKDVADDVGDLQTDVGTLQTDVGTLQTNVGTLQTNVGTLQTNVAALQSNFAIGALTIDSRFTFNNPVVYKIGSMCFICGVLRVASGTLVLNSNIVPITYPTGFGPDLSGLDESSSYPSAKLYGSTTNMIADVRAQGITFNSGGEAASWVNVTLMYPGEVQNV